MQSGALPVRPDFSAPSTKQKVFQCFFDHMSLGDHSVVTNIIVTKVSVDSVGARVKFG
jgi:hypothetical protein